MALTSLTSLTSSLTTPYSDYKKKYLFYLHKFNDMSNIYGRNYANIMNKV